MRPRISRAVSLKARVFILMSVAPACTCKIEFRDGSGAAMPGIATTGQIAAG